MDIRLPNGKVIRGIPEGTTKAEIQSKAISAGLASEADFRNINKPMEAANKLLQGMTFGFGDELSAAAAAGVTALRGDMKFGDAYGMFLDQARKNMDAFEAQNPKTAMASEIAGAVATGGLAGGKLLTGLNRASTLGKYGRLAAVGAAEGGLYGAGTAEEGERASQAAKGAAVGAVAAPVGAKLIDMALQGGKSLASFAGRKLADTPRSEAVRAIRRAAEAEGVDADDAIRMLDELGPDATLSDLGENFRFLSRAATDQGGQFKTQARRLMNNRQAGQQDRIMQAAEVAAGQRAGDFGRARQALIQGRKEASKPLYDRAFQEGVQLTDELAELLERPALKSSLSKASRMAADEGHSLSARSIKNIDRASIKKGIKDAIDADDEFSEFGLRVIPEGWEVRKGVSLPHSKRWVDGSITGEDLGGVSTIGVDARNIDQAIDDLINAGYKGNQIALVKGISAQVGEDIGEVIIQDPVVSQVWGGGQANLMTRLHYAKMDLDDRIGTAVRQGKSNQVRILSNLKNDLLDQIDSQNPAYREARQLFSGDTQMIRSLDEGLELFKASPDDLAESVRAMTPSERDLFKLGAVRAIKNKLDATGETYDSTKRLLNTKAMRQKLSLVFDDPDEFIQRALSENEFSRTRNVLTGGSPTAERLAGQESLSSGIQPEMLLGLATKDPVAITATLARIFGKHKVTPEVVEELAGMMLKQGMEPNEVRRIFTTPALQRQFGRVYDEVILPTVAGSLAPAQAASQ